jgi:hypothetical protein
VDFGAFIVKLKRLVEKMINELMKEIKTDGRNNFNRIKDSQKSRSPMANRLMSCTAIGNLSSDLNILPKITKILMSRYLRL